MKSKSVLREVTVVIRETLLQNNQLTISGLGTLKVKSVPSEHERLSEQKFMLRPPRKRVVLEGDPSLTTDESLISGLASNLGASHEEVAAVINLLIKEILAQMPVHIPEIGILKQSDGKLEFSPDPELEAFLAGAHANLNSLEIKKERPSTSVRHRRKFNWRIAIPIIVVIAAIGGYFVIQNYFPPSQQASNDAESPTILPVAPDSISADSAANITSIDRLDTVDQSIEYAFRVRPEPNPEQPLITLDDATDPPAVETSPLPADPETPLLNRETGGYTLVIGSFDTPEQASILIDEYRELYPTIPVDTLRNHDNTLYRVAIGQVPTIPEALALKDRLTELPAQAWVLNILNTDL
ncbi:MAG: SPOR domain-containing protein [Bacteroidetes bacterium]|nr:SPOR domain-containing protein [Bacteroidota bacterium]